jgi:hypothetical protein
MADELEPEGHEGDEGEEKPPKEPEKPQVTGLTRDDILGIVREAVGPTVRESIRALQAERQAGAPEPEIDDIKDEELDAAIAAGGGSATAIRRAIKAEAERLARKLSKEKIDPLQATGSRALSRLALRAAAPEMAYYERFKKEIDSAAANVPPDRVGDPDYLIEVHDYLVGRNWKAIQQEEREKVAREADKPKGTATAGASGGRAGLRSVAGGKAGLLKPEDVFSKGELDALLDLGKNNKGRPTGKTFEDFCENILHRDPQEYLREVLKDREAGLG